MSDTLAAEPVDAVDDAGAASGQKRMLMIVGGLAALLVLGLAVYFLFLSGGGDEEDFGALPPAAPAPANTDDTKKDGKNDADQGTVPEEFSGNLGRDPFVPLSVEKVVETEAPVEPTDTTTNTGTDGGTNPAPAPTVNPAPTSSPKPTPTDDPDPQTTTYKVTLLSVNVAKGEAKLEVNGKSYVVKEGKLFTNTKSGPFKLLSVSELPNGKDVARVKFGSDAPVELTAKEKTTFTVG